MTITERPTLARKRCERAQQGYYRAIDEYIKALVPVIAEDVRRFYPEAAALNTHGELTEEWNLKLSVKAVLVGNIVIDDEEGTAGAYQAYQKGDPRTKFETMAEEIDGNLEWLAELTGDDYLGDNELELP